MKMARLARAEKEPAGAESLFSTAKSMRQERFPAATRRLRRSVIDRLRQRRQRRRGQSLSVEEIDWDIWGVERVREALALPDWAYKSLEEEKRLAAMKLLVEENLAELVNTTVQIGSSTRSVLEAFPDVYGDLRLLRFLRKDKQQDPVSAAGRYAAFLQWRQVHAVDELRAAVEVQPFVLASKHVAEHIPCDFNILVTSETTDTLPIVLHVGDWDTTAMSNLIRNGTVDMQEFLGHWIYLFESLHRQLYWESYRQSTMVYVDEICDLKTMHMGQLSPGFVSTVLKPWITMTQTYYPETTARIRFLNPPRILSLAWAIVSKMVSPSTVQKVKLYPEVEGTPYDFVARHHR